MKILVGTALLLILAGTVFSRPGDIGNIIQKSQPTLIPTHGEGKQTNGQANQANSSSNSPSRNAALQRPHWWSDSNWWLVGIATITAGIICWQSYETRRTATSALLNTQAMINAERAWIVVSVDSATPGEFRFWATNEGKTPARVLSIWFCKIPLMRSQKLNIPPDKQTGESLLQSPPCLIPPKAKQFVGQCNVADFQKASGGGEGEKSLFSRGFGSGYIFGRIRYVNVLESDAKEPHETRWLYWLVPVEGSVPFPDPMHPEHNTYT